ncbi:hypothetical protein [Okeania sp. SIO2C2]|uniref:hypothetical protein n=1 Tax=Okeania sp. SIO2C2 TaxID=2607787 RepID=UPI00257E48F3|nr:hypothetical protein [Okeania sp. SIO2C2]
MVKLGVLRSQPTPRPSQEGRGTQESGGERITKMRVVMTIEDFFYAQLNGFDIIKIIAMCAGIFTNYSNCPIAKSLILSVFYSPR